MSKKKKIYAESFSAVFPAVMMISFFLPTIVKKPSAEKKLVSRRERQ
jgi:hypothetical protein